MLQAGLNNDRIGEFYDVQMGCWLSPNVSRIVEVVNVNNQDFITVSLNDVSIRLLLFV